jgi:hypothetical protein
MAQDDAKDDALGCLKKELARRRNYPCMDIHCRNSPAIIMFMVFMRLKLPP